MKLKYSWCGDPRPVFLSDSPCYKYKLLGFSRPGLEVINIFVLNSTELEISTAYNLKC